MSQIIIKALEQIGPCTTPILIKYLANKSGTSPSTIRQRITRAKGSIKKLAGIRLAHNARFIYLEKQYGTGCFWRALERALKEEGPSYWATIVALRNKGGRCFYRDFPIVCGNPIRRKGHLSPEIILNRLEKINVLETSMSEDGNSKYIELNPMFDEFTHRTTERSFRARMLAEEIAINGVKEWARRLGLGSYGKFRMRGDRNLPEVAHVAWDISAPSYALPIASIQPKNEQGKELKPGFLVCDLHYNEIDEDLVNTFIRKYYLATGPRNIAPVMALLIAERFKPSALDKAKSAGMLVSTISNLFGEEITKALRDLIELLSDTGEKAVANPALLEQVMSALGRIEGSTNNMRGDMFELAIGTLIKDIEEGYVLMGYNVFSRGRAAEIDVLLDKDDNNETLIIECKAKSPSSKVSVKEVEKWQCDRVPLINEALRQEPRYQDRNIRFELWTNGIFHASALEYFNTIETSFDDHSLALRNGSEIKVYAQRTRNGHITKMLNEHYFRHPLTRL